ncbi:hypothetical protein [Nocardioides convexus]|uniref:hypothetical protein n=1 Tax=Nocardioides convexus TaxID=2712224 RepID=UPI002418B88B|nr:hypothetical protein [Nocardioides convexus]
MRHLVPRSLTSRLVVTAVALVAVVIVLIGAVTTLAMRSYQMDRLDGDLTDALHRAEGPGPRGTGLPEVPSGGEVPDVRFRFGEIGLVTLLYTDDRAYGWVISGRNDQADPTLSSDAATALKRGARGTPRTVEPAGARRATASCRRRASRVRPSWSACPPRTWTTPPPRSCGGRRRWRCSGSWPRRWPARPSYDGSLRPLTEVAATAHAVAEPAPGVRGDRGHRAGARAAHRSPHRGRPGGPGAQPACSPTWSPRCPRGTAASSRCASSWPTPRTSLRTPLTTIAGYTEPGPAPGRPGDRGGGAGEGAGGGGADDRARRGPAAARAPRRRPAARGGAGRPDPSAARGRGRRPGGRSGAPLADRAARRRRADRGHR